MGNDPYGINREVIDRIVAEIGEVVRLGVQIAVVIGGGNIFRGVAPGAAGMDRATADYMGMLATLMNALALQDAMRRAGLVSRVQSALSIEQVAEPYIRGKALRYLEENKVVIFAAGTGNPFFTTDTAAALRGREMGVDIVLKATKVDGVYTTDPNKDPTAKRYRSLTFDEAIVKNLKVMDATALALCRDQNMLLKVFSIFAPGALRRVVMGEDWHACPLLRRAKEDDDRRRQEDRRAKMQKSVRRSTDLGKVRTGRAHTGLLDHLKVDYGPMMRSTRSPTSRSPTHIPSPSAVEKKWSVVEKAIRDSYLGIIPATSGDVIRVPMPALTEERRKELVKVVHKEAENTRIAVRNIRRDAITHLKDLLKAKSVSEDDERRAQDEIQKLTDRYIAEVDKVLHTKEADLMAV